MTAATGPRTNNSLKALSRSVNRPWITLAAIVLAVVLGVLRLPFLEYLRPLGDFYISLLKICVLPFLLAAIPLAVRSAMVSESAPGVLRSLLTCLLISLLGVASVSTVVSSLFFAYSSPDEQLMTNIGAILGRSGEGIDIEFAIDARLAPEVKGAADGGILAIIPTNIFAALAANDSVRVLVFAAIFGIAMVLTERESGRSTFGALRHIEAVCIRIFDWFGLLVPIGIVALVAPQIALLGPDALTVLKLFAYAFFSTSTLLLLAVVLLSSFALGTSPLKVLGALLKPVMLGASTRNSLICIPLALETLKDDLKVRSEPCDLYIPIGFATIRFGTILYFVTATLFIGVLMGRQFSLIDLAYIGILSVGASFATLGVSGLVALAPLAMVLRPFGLSYEVAIPLMVIIDPLAEMVRTLLNVAINCMIPVVAGGRAAADKAQPTATPSKECG
jgi:Na+/H+-dicarboxylate symporter